MRIRRSRERPLVIDWAVFALALFLAGFIAYELARRRVKAPAPAAAPGLPEAPLAPPGAPVQAPDLLPQRAGRVVPGNPYVKTVIVPRKRAGEIPPPPR